MEVAILKIILKCTSGVEYNILLQLYVYEYTYTKISQTNGVQNEEYNFDYIYYTAI